MEEKDNGYWFTTENGVHIHANEGESPEEATNKFFGKSKEYRQNIPYKELTNEKNKHIIKEQDGLAIKGAAAASLYNDIRNNKRFEYEELLNNPVVKELEDKANKAMEMATNKPPLSEQDKQRYTEKFLQSAKNTPRNFRADIVMGLPAAGKSSAVVNDLKTVLSSSTTTKLKSFCPDTTSTARHTSIRTAKMCKRLRRKHLQKAER